MSTLAIPETLDDAPCNLEAIEAVATAVRAEVDAVDPGPMATDDDTKTLYRYLRLRMYATAELTSLKDQMDAMVRSAESRVKTLDHFYSEFAARVVAAKIKGSVARSIKTPFGTLGFRASKPRSVVGDEAAAIEALTKLGQAQCVRRTPSIDKAELDKYIAATGEMPDGVDMTDGGDVFYLPK